MNESDKPSSLKTIFKARWA